MKKLLILAALLLVACQEPPLPAFAGSDIKCRYEKCSTFIGDFPQTYPSVATYPDKNYDSILGHHDYSDYTD